MSKSFEFRKSNTATPCSGILQFNDVLNADSKLKQSSIKQPKAAYKCMKWLALNF